MCFLKADKSERHMLCRYRGGLSYKPNLLAVWDVAKEAPRTINLSTTFRVVDPATGSVLYSSEVADEVPKTGQLERAGHSKKDSIS